MAFMDTDRILCLHQHGFVYSRNGICMKTLLNKWFILGCVIWTTTFVLRKLKHPIPYFNSYLTDAFAIPVVANLGLWFQRNVIYKSNKYILGIGHVIFIVTYVSIVFEFFLPRYSNKYTSDWLDVVMYIGGGVFFFKVMNKPLV
jgi:hypothetical protein